MKIPLPSIIKKLCTPAFVYFVLGVISILVAISYGLGFYSILAKVILILTWTWFLNYLCFKGLKGLSWFLVIVPYLMLVVAVLVALDAMNTHNDLHQQLAGQQEQESMYYSGALASSSRFA